MAWTDFISELTGSITDVSDSAVDVTNDLRTITGGPQDIGTPQVAAPAQLVTSSTPNMDKTRGLSGEDLVAKVKSIPYIKPIAIGVGGLFVTSWAWPKIARMFRGR